MKGLEFVIVGQKLHPKLVETIQNFEWMLTSVAGADPWKTSECR